MLGNLKPSLSVIWVIKCKWMSWAVYETRRDFGWENVKGGDCLKDIGVCGLMI